MEDKIENYEYLWNNKGSGWALFRGEHNSDIEYSIVNCKDKTILIIENDEIYCAVKKKMLESGVPIVWLGNGF